MNRQTMVEQLRRVAAYTTQAEEDATLYPAGRYDVWQWGQGVALYGLVKVYEALAAQSVQEDGRWLAAVQQWVDARLLEGKPGKSINTTAPLLAVLKLAQQTGDERYVTLCRDFADWALAEAPRADFGAFEHSCTENVYPQQVWADTLFMGCIFLARWGSWTGQKLYGMEALRQFRLHYHLLHDADTGLIYHGYDGAERACKGVLWGRGNGWYAAAAVDVLQETRELPGWAAVLQDFNQHLTGVKRTQHNSGAWHTVMDKPHTYLEMSCTAAFAYALNTGVRQGLLPATDRVYAQQAVQTLLESIDERGAVQHGSGGTCVMSTASDYHKIPYNFSYFTQGLALMALSSECLLPQ